MRGLVQFPKPPDTVPEEEAASDGGSKSVHQVEADVTGDDKAAPAEEETGETDQTPEEPSFSRHWFNTVLYGTPMLLLNPPKGV